MLILAIETSCDETSAAVVKDGNEVLSNVISSQIEFHKKYGGIVPEVAARKHIEVISLVIKEALDQAKCNIKEIEAVAVTYGPGLVGSLMVGLCAAKAIAWSLNVPLIGVNHLEGHLYANFLPPTPYPLFPFICLLVSGGHTMLIKVNDHGQYETLGRTRDDAAGEAFDKVARFLGLGYPGGPIIDKLAKEGDPKAVKFTRPMPDGYDFSFSGIKTGIVNLKTRDPRLATRDIVASFQQAVIDVLVDKAVRAARENGCQIVALAGGVSANSLLRKQLTEQCLANHLTAHIPPFEYCTDNAAMIACAAFHKLSKFGFRISDFNLSAVASLKI